MTFERLLADDEVPQQKERIIKIVNLLSVATAITVFILGPYLYVITGYSEILYPALIEGSLFLIVPMLNKKGKHQSALKLMFSVHTAAVGYFTLILGPESNITAFALFLSASAYTIFEDKKPFAIAITTIVLMMAGVKASYYYQIVPTLQLNPFALKNLNWTVDISVYILTASILYCHSIERKLNERIKKILMTRLDAANKAKSVYLRETAHEMRLHLNLIYGTVQNYDLGNKTDDQFVRISQSHFNSLRLACKNLKEIVNNNLVWARIEAGLQDELSNEPLRIRDWLLSEIHAHNSMGNEKNVEIIINTEGLPEIVVIDHQKLLRILTNLLSNAIKFTRKDTVIEIACFQSGEDQLVFTITDEGKGIPADKMAHIFTQFVTEAKQGTESSGLGLPIAKHLAQVMKGDLNAESTMGIGTKFTLVLPLVLPEYTQQTLNTKAQDDVSQRDAKSETVFGKRILVLDDAEIALIMTGKLIEFMEAKPILLQSPTDMKEVFEAIKNHQPDVILLDLHMPGLTGREILIELLANSSFADIPVVIQSGDAFTEIQDELREMGASGFIVKPLVYRELLDTLATLLHSTIKTPA